MLAKLFFHSRQCAGQGIGIQFAQRMKMQTGNAVQFVRAELVQRNPQARTGGRTIRIIALMIT